MSWQQLYAPMPNVPLLTDLSRGDAQKEPISRFVSLAMSVSRPLAAPPNVPADRVAILRRAFDATMKDPAFLADAARRKLDIEPLRGPEVQKIVADAVATAPAVVEMAKRATARPN